MLLPVSAPFHCSLMVPAQERLRADLDATGFSDLVCPLVNNWQAREVRLGAEAREGLYQQVPSPVRWLESIRNLAANVSFPDQFHILNHWRQLPTQILSQIFQSASESFVSRGIDDFAIQPFAVDSLFDQAAELALNGNRPQHVLGLILDHDPPGSAVGM